MPRNAVPLQLVEEVSSVLRDCSEREFNNGKVWVHELLKGSSVYIAPPKVRPRVRPEQRRSDDFDPRESFISIFLTCHSKRLGP